jgi:hypothetical protein
MAGAALSALLAGGAHGQSATHVSRSIDVYWDQPQQDEPVVSRIVLNGRPLKIIHEVRHLSRGRLSLVVYCPAQPQGPSKVKIWTTAHEIHIAPASEGCGVYYY